MFDLNKEVLNQIDISYIKEFCLYNDQLGEPKKGGILEFCGKEPYRLYAHLSTKFDDSIILDIGTWYGNSALSFSYNPTNKVISYDLQDLGASKISKENITWKIMNFMEDDTIDYNKVSLILIDVDPHDGNQEPVMVQYLKDIGWSGILLFDDIHLNSGMESFWNSLDEKNKYDITNFGHWSGTGLVKF